MIQGFNFIHQACPSWQTTLGLYANWLLQQSTGEQGPAHDRLFQMQYSALMSRKSSQYLAEVTSIGSSSMMTHCAESAHTKCSPCLVCGNKPLVVVVLIAIGYNDQDVAMAKVTAMWHNTVRHLAVLTGHLCNTYILSQHPGCSACGMQTTGNSCSGTSDCLELFSGLHD